MKEKDPNWDLQSASSRASGIDYGSKKKAADFYFKGKPKESKPLTARKDDFMTQGPPINSSTVQVSPTYKASVNPSPTFTYDKVVSPTPKTTSTNAQRWSTKKKAADHYLKNTSATKTTTLSNRKSYTKSPTNR